MPMKVGRSKLVPICRRFTGSGGEATPICCEVWDREWESSHQFIARYATYPEFHGRLALVDRRAARMGFGHGGFVGNWWYGRVLKKPGKDDPAVREALSRS